MGFLDQNQLESLSKLKPTGGIFKGAIWLVIVYCIATSSVAYKAVDQSKSWWVVLIIIGITSFIVFSTVAGIIWFAVKHPALSTLDDLFFLLFSKQGTKDQDSLPPSQPSVAHPLPRYSEEVIKADDSPPPPQESGPEPEPDSKGRWV